MRKNKQLLNIVYTAVFAALIAAITSQIKFSTGINEGYIHFGDAMVYLGACVLPLPYALAAAAIGGATADILAGAAVWAVPTAMIKALTALPFALVFALKKSNQPKNILNIYTGFMPIVAGLITIFGYFLAEGLMYTFPTAWVSVPINCIQAVGSAFVYYMAAFSLDKLNFKSKMYRS